jgi:WD40 repeat protein
MRNLCLSISFAILAGSAAAECSEDALITSWHSQGRCTSVEFSPDGTRLLVQSPPHTIRIFDTMTGHVLAQQEFEGSFCQWTESGAVFSPNGSVAAAGVNNTVLVLDTNDGSLLHTLRTDDGRFLIGALAFSRDGSLLAAAGQGGRAYVWSTQKGDLVAEFPAPMALVDDLVFSPDAEYLVAGGMSGGASLAFWDIDTWQLSHRLKTGLRWVYCIEFSPDGELLACGGPSSLAVWPINESDLSMWRNNYEECCPGQFVQFSPDGRFLVTGIGPAHLLLLNSETGGEIARWPAHTEAGIHDADFSPDGKLLASVGYDTMIEIWDVERILEQAGR